MRRKQRLYSKAKKSGSEFHWAKFREIKQKVHSNLKVARENYINNFLGESIKENPKRFWTYVKKLNKDDVGIPDFEINGDVISDRKNKSELLSKHFSSVFSHENISNIPEIPRSLNLSTSSPVISIREVVAQLSALKPDKAPGPDGIPPRFMKEYANEIAPTLTKIFQESIDSGIVPKK